MEIYIPFPKGRELFVEIAGRDLFYLEVLDPPIFNGSANMLSAHIEQLDGTIKYRASKRRLRTIPRGTNYLDLHFLPFKTFFGKEREPRNFAEKVRALQGISTDFAQLAQNLSDPNYLTDVSLLFGTTNPRMAQFATHRLGFYKAITQRGSLERQEEEDHPGTVTIIALRNEFVQNYTSGSWGRIAKAVESRKRQM